MSTVWSLFGPDSDQREWLHGIHYLKGLCPNSISLTGKQVDIFEVLLKEDYTGISADPTLVEVWLDFVNDWLSEHESERSYTVIIAKEFKIFLERALDRRWTLLWA